MNLTRGTTSWRWWPSGEIPALITSCGLLARPAFGRVDQLVAIERDFLAIHSPARTTPAPSGPDVGISV